MRRIAIVLLRACLVGSWAVWVASAQPPPPKAQPAQIPADAAFYQAISWSPDGSHLAFCLLKGGKWSIYLMRLSGGEVSKLLPDSEMMMFYVAWSPDGKKIAFNAKTNPTSKSDIYTVNVDGSGLTQLTTDPANDSAPTWSPDGNYLAFSSDRDGRNHIYVMRKDGSRQTQVTNGETRDFNPDWSPDGRRIVYYAEKGDKHDQVWIVDRDGKNPLLLTGGVGHNIFPAWMPDSKRIVFASQREDTGDHAVLYTVKANGSDLKRLSDQQAFLARVSPDGSRIAFLAGQFPKNAIYVMNADGTHIVKSTPYSRWS